MPCIIHCKVDINVLKWLVLSYLSYLDLLKKVKKTFCTRVSIRICTKSYWDLFWAEHHPPSKLCVNLFCSFCVILITNLTRKQTSVTVLVELMTNNVMFYACWLFTFVREEVVRVCPLSQLWAFSTSSRKFTSVESTLHHMMLVSANCASSHVRLLLHLHQTSYPNPYRNIPWKQELNGSPTM